MKVRLIFASFGSRLVAYIIDLTILFIITSLIWTIFSLPVPERNVLTNFRGLVLFSNPFGSIMGWLYFALLESSSIQGSLGKHILGLKVVNERGGTISFINATGRYFAKIVSTVILFLGYANILISRKKQALHDVLASTYVVVDIKQIIEKGDEKESSLEIKNIQRINKPDFKNEREILLDLYNKQILTSEEFQLKMDQLSAKEAEIIEKIKIREKEIEEKQNHALFQKELNKRTQPLITQIEKLKKTGVLNDVEFNDKKLHIKNRCRLELENDIKNSKVFFGEKIDTKEPTSNKRLYEKELKLLDGRSLQIIKDMGFFCSTEVFIDDDCPDDGFYRLYNGKIAYEIENGKIKMEYYIEKFKQDEDSEIEVGGSRITGISKQSPVWLNGKIAPDGEYKKGLFSRIKVKNGRII
jgi:uncharacterized RDD family membrane protein YckC